MNKAVFLIGFMGVGKTSLGKKLANKLKVPFLDTDDLLEEKVGMSIAEYFSNKGEEAFRKLEKELLTHYDFKNAVVATGGGLPCFDDNIEVMNEIGTTVYLSRPAKEFIKSKLEERRPFYEKANFTLDRNSQTVDDLIYNLAEHG